MKRFGAWLWKEWRDQRAVTIGILIAVPALTALAYWAFGDRIGVAPLDKVRTIFLGIAVGLVVFAIAGDLFAGENRRNTIHAVRRLPGSMRAAFLAKLTYLCALVVVAIALQGVSLAVAENINTPNMTALGMSTYYHNGATRSVHLFGELAHFPGSTLWMTGLGFGVFGLWTLLVSSWMGRSGVAGIGALVLIAAVATPFVLFFKDHPWFFPGPLRLVAWVSVVGALVAVVAMALSFLRGQRFAGRPFRPVLFGMAVLLVAMGGTYAYARQSLDDWLDIRPTDEDFHIQSAHVGAAGRYLYLNVHRGAAWNNGQRIGHHHSDDLWRAQRGSPLQAWVVDTQDGSHRVLDDRAERYFEVVPETHGSHHPFALDPVEALVAYRLDSASDGATAMSLSWWDARAGKQVRILPSNVRDQETLDLVRRELSNRTWLRDSQGRRVWMRGPHVEREGASFKAVGGIVPWQPRGRAMALVPGGWLGYRFAEGKRAAGWNYIDAENGEIKRLSIPKRGYSFWTSNVLSADYAIVHQQPGKGEAGGVRARKRLLSFEDPKIPRPLQDLPRVVSNVVGENQVLALRGEAKDLAVHVWNPVTGEDRALVWQGRAPERIAAATVWGRTGDGRLVLNLNRSDGTSRSAWAVLASDLKHVRLIRSWGSRGGPVALLENNSLVMLEDDTIVRYEPGGERNVLFPRR